MVQDVLQIVVVEYYVEVFFFWLEWQFGDVYCLLGLFVMLVWQVQCWEYCCSDVDCFDQWYEEGQVEEEQWVLWQWEFVVLWQQQLYVDVQQGVVQVVGEQVECQCLVEWQVGEDVCLIVQFEQEGVVKQLFVDYLGCIC